MNGIGSLLNRGTNKWALIFDVDDVIDTVTGKPKRKQKWVSFRGTKPEAAKELTRLVGKTNDHEFVEPNKMTVAQWLTTWLEKDVKGSRRVRTFHTYVSVCSQLTATLGTIPIQQLRPIDVQNYYSSHATLSAATVRLHAAVLSSALKSALTNSLVTRNVARLAGGKPKIDRRPDDLDASVLDLNDARRLLAAAKEAGPRQAAFYALALDSGARIGELCGLQWPDIDFDKGRMTIKRQLISSTLAEDGTVQYGVPKTGKARTVDLGAETIARLRTLKQHQAEVKLKNRTVYRDHQLVFAKEAPDLFGAHTALGTPLQYRNIGRLEFKKLLKAAGVKTIVFHGLRHSSATLLLLAGENAKVVSERLGHSKISITLDCYSHLLPSMGRGAADRLGALLHG